MDGRIAYLRPSGAAIWSKCGGYIAMRAMYPDAPEESDNEVCEEGTACHWLADELWNGRQHVPGEFAPNGRELTEDMFDAVDLYHDTLRDPAWAEGETYIERKLDCGFIYPGMEGTADALTYKHVRIRSVDLKYGFRPVEVYENRQLTIYTVALGNMLCLPNATVAELTIVQPRCFHRDGPVRKWITTLGVLRKLAEELSAAAHAAMSDTPLYTVNDGCIDCPGRHVCPALQRASYTALEVSMRGEALEMPADVLGGELLMLTRAKKLLEARISGMQEQAKHIIASGKRVPYWTLGATFARETWKPDEEARIIALAPYFGADARRPARAVTPNQARKLGIPRDVVDSLAHKPSTGVKLVPVDEKQAAKAFSQHPIK